jgi:excisionase family DNA binding protein
MRKNPPPNLQAYLTIRQAADLIGASTSTLRAWDRAGKLKATRNPMNRYRLYRREDIEALLARIQKTATASPAEARTRRGGER